MIFSCIFFPCSKFFSDLDGDTMDYVFAVLFGVDWVRLTCSRFWIMDCGDFWILFFDCWACLKCLF